MSGHERPRVLFAGTPAFAARALERIVDAGFPVVGVLTQPDRPAGRGQKTVGSAVKQLAQTLGLVVLQPISLRDDASRDLIAALHADVMIVAAYGLILPPAVLELPPLGCLNIHASLLPRWRGAAPIQRAIEAGDPTTGVCIMRMEAGLDTGPVCLRRELAIADDETAASLHDRLAAIGSEAIVEALRALASGSPSFIAQPTEGITYAHKLSKAQAVIDWRRSAEEIGRQLRAFDPVPGSTAALERDPSTVLRLFRPTVLERASQTVLPSGTDSSVRPGTVLAIDPRGVIVACGTGALSVGEWQRPGGRRLGAREFLAGFPVNVGDRFVLSSSAD